MGDIEIASQWVSVDKGVQLYSKTYSPAQPKALLFFVHGFVEHIDRYTHVFPRFANAGYKVFAFDQRGFGRSAHERPGNPKAGLTNWKLALGDIQKLIFEFAKQNEGMPLFLMGHSMVWSHTMYNYDLNCV